MSFFIPRIPLAIPALAVTIGAILGLYAEGPYELFAIVFFAMFLITFLLWKRRSESIFLVLLFLFCLFGEASNAYRNRVEFYDTEEDCSFACRVIRVQKRDSLKTSFVVETDTLRAKTFEAYEVKGMLTIEGGADDIVCGTRLLVHARIIQPWVDLFSDFDYGKYLCSQGYSFLAESDSVTMLRDEGFSLSSAVGYIQEWFDSCLCHIGISRENVGFLRALVLADRSQLSSDIRSSFANCGTSHVLAVSGLHVGVISGAIIILLSFFVRGRIAAIVAVIVLWCYAVLVGLSPSVVRASIMFSFIQLGRILGRTFHPYHTLTAALFFTLIFDPLAVQSVGFWLSYSAVGAILTIAPLMREHLPRSGATSWLTQSLAVSIISQIATTPITLYVFHLFPCYFWANNLIVIPIISLVFICAILCPIFAYVPYVGTAIGYFLDKVLSFLVGYTSWAGSLSGAVLRDIPFGIAELIVSSVVVVTFMIFLYRPSWKRLRPVMISCLVMFAFFAVSDLRTTTQRQLQLYVSNGRTCLMATNGSHAYHLLSDSLNRSSLRAMNYVNKKNRVSESVYRQMSSVEIIHHDSIKVCVINDKHVSIPKCDICIINADVLPQDMDCHKMRFIITPFCHFAELWHRRFSNVKILPYNCVYSIEKD